MGVRSVGALGITIYTLSIRFWGTKYQLPLYKYPFNAATGALCVGIASQIGHSMNPDGNFLTPSLALVALAYYGINTGLVSCVVGLQLAVDPLRFWIKGTQENGPGEASLFAVGILGAVTYQQNPWAIVAVFAPVVITYFAFSRLARKIYELEEAEDKLQQAKEELEVRVRARTSDLSNATEELAQSRRRIVYGQEQLRKAVAQHLHGPVQNRILVATHWLRAAQNDVSDDPARSAEYVGKAVELIEEINQGDLRTAVSRLHPSIIRVSLQAALRSLAGGFQGNFEIGVSADEETADSEEMWRSGLSEEMRLAIYRVAEEALNNVQKHTNATKVDLRLTRLGEERVAMIIRDNGNGFDVSSLTPGFGILSMQDYCGAVGGLLQMKSDIGVGTSITASFPVAGPVAGKKVVEEPRSILDIPVDVSALISSQPEGLSVADEVLACSEEVGAVTTLMIVDDQPDFCGLVSDLLRPYGEFQVVGESHDGRKALLMAGELQPEVVLLDVDMPGLDGLETAHQLNNLFPAIRVVLMSAYHQREYIQETMPKGVVDYINKAEFSVSRLRQACRQSIGFEGAVAEPSPAYAD